VESLETVLFEEPDIPWDEMAFPVVVRSLQRFFADRSGQRFEPFIDTIVPQR
jgi:hypothetical protein